MRRRFGVGPDCGERRGAEAGPATAEAGGRGRCADAAGGGPGAAGCRTRQGRASRRHGLIGSRFRAASGWHDSRRCCRSSRKGYRCANARHLLLRVAAVRGRGDEPERRRHRLEAGRDVDAAGDVRPGVRPGDVCGAASRHDHARRERDDRAPVGRRHAVRDRRCAARAVHGGARHRELAAARCRSGDPDAVGHQRAAVQGAAVRPGPGHHHDRRAEQSARRLAAARAVARLVDPGRAGLRTCARRDRPVSPTAARRAGARAARYRARS